MTSPSSKSWTLAIAVKKYTKRDTKAFYSCPALLEFFTLFQTFRSGLQIENFYVKGGKFNQNFQNFLKPSTLLKF